VGLVLFLGAEFGLVAQSRFNAKNLNTSPILAVDGVTKLSKAVGRVEIVYKGVVLNTGKKTFAADGIFSLGALLVPDVPPGGTAAITVRVWDSSVGATFADALGAGCCFAASTFDVQYLTGGADPPPAMDNFKGLTLNGKSWCLHTDAISVKEGAFAEFTLPDQGASNGRPASILTNSFTWSGRSPAGTFGGTLPNVTYQPAAHSYASDDFSYHYPFGFGSDSFCLVYTTITVIPAPERSGPALVAESTSGKVIPKLRGLDGHRYRIEKSADLSAWTSAGEVTGNFSEVDLSPFLAPGDRAQFVRATEITPP
jgi:hypothetical protein